MSQVFSIHKLPVEKRKVVRCQKSRVVVYYGTAWKVIGTFRRRSKSIRIVTDQRWRKVSHSVTGEALQSVATVPWECNPSLAPVGQSPLHEQDKKIEQTEKARIGVLEQSAQHVDFSK